MKVTFRQFKILIIFWEVRVIALSLPTLQKKVLVWSPLAKVHGEKQKGKIQASVLLQPSFATQCPLNKGFISKR